VPRKIDLYWFMPALVKSSVGSESGTTEDEGTVKLYGLIYENVNHRYHTDRKCAHVP